MRGIGLGGCEQVRERRAGPRRGQRDRSEHHERGATAARGTRTGVRGRGGGGVGSKGKRRGGRTAEHREVVLVLGDQLRVLRQVERGGGGGGGLRGGTSAAEVALLEADRVDHVESALAFTSSLRVRRQRDARKQCASSGGLGLRARTRLLLL